MAGAGGFQMSCHRRTLVVGCLIAGALGLGNPADAQAQAAIGEVTQRPFVIGVIPVVGNGTVGGVAIDADGVMAKAETRDVGALRDARREAAAGVAGNVAQR